LETHAKSYVARKREIGIENTCMLLVDYTTMKTRAYVGSVDFFDERIQGQVNGITAKRSPGSTIKPFIYALALEQGLIHQMTMLKDSPTSFGSYQPDNFDGEFEGPVKARDALIKSRNVPAVYLASKLAKPDLYELLVTGGVEGLKAKEHYGLSLVLGGAELSMAELVRLYALLANKGVLKQTRDREAVRNERRVKEQILLSPESCFLVLDILSQNPRPDLLGNSEWASGASPVYWKTGTSMAFKDAWTVGIFDNFVLCVWIGNFNGAGNPAFVSLKAAAPLFFEIVDALRANRLSEEKPLGAYWEIPPTVKKIQVCALSGKIPNDFCRSRIPAWFIPGKSPISVCDIHREVYIDTRTGYRTTMFSRGSTRAVVYEFWPSDLLDLFEQAGIPRKVPPPFDPTEAYGLRERTGRQPEITSPRSKTDYVVRLGDAAGTNIPFTAVADADSAEVFWFVDDAFIGKSKTGATLFWNAKPGTFNVRVVDEQGRADECVLRVLLSN
jgi:penicillin-binding protein 1C